MQRGSWGCSSSRPFAAALPAPQAPSSLAATRTALITESLPLASPLIPLPHTASGWLAGSWCPESAPLHLYPGQACGPSPVILVQWISCFGTDPVLISLPTPLRTLNPRNVIFQTVRSSLFIQKYREKLFLHKGRHTHRAVTNLLTNACSVS